MGVTYTLKQKITIIKKLGAKSMAVSNRDNSYTMSFKDVLFNLFSVKNLIVYILAICISLVGIQTQNGFLLPFSVAMLAATYSNNLPLAIILSGMSIGTFAKFGVQSGIEFLITSIIIILISFIKRPEPDEENRIDLSMHVIIAMLINCVVMTIINGMNLDMIFIGFVKVLLTFIFYKIFTNSIDIVQSYKNKRAVTIEELMGASVLVGVAILSISPIVIFGISLRNVLMALLVLLVGWDSGIVAGLTAGAFDYLLIAMNDNNPIMALFGLILGLVAGISSEVGRKGFIFGFLIADVVIVYTMRNDANALLRMQEILIALLFLIIPAKRKKVEVRDIMHNYLMLPETAGVIEEAPEELVKKELLNQESVSQEEIDQKIIDNFEKNVYKNIEKIKNNMLYADVYKNENDLLKEIFENIKVNYILTESEAIKIFNNHNIYVMNSTDKSVQDGYEIEIREMIREINSAYKETKKKYSKLSDQIERAKKKEKAVVKGYIHEEIEVQALLISKGITVLDINIERKQNSRFVIEISIIYDEENIKNPVKEIERTLGNILKEKIVLNSIQENEDNKYIFTSVSKYEISIAKRLVTKDDELESNIIVGETKLENENTLVEIIEGNSSFREIARKDAKTMSNAIEQILNSKLKSRAALRLINDSIENAEKEQKGSTVDLSVFDLYEGKARIVKNTVVPTFIMEKEKIMIIAPNVSSGLQAYDHTIKTDTLIVMCNKYLLNSTKKYMNGAYWIREMLQHINSDDPERIAEIIMNEAKQNLDKEIKNDLGIIVIKIIKK